MALVTDPRILVVSATRHGSTTEVAEAIAEEMRAAGVEVDVRAASNSGAPVGYDAVVVGGPMIMGWHKDARRYVKRHGDQLKGVPTAYFITAASLTETGDDEVDHVPIVKDPWLAKAPRDAQKLGFKERYARPSHYLGDILKETAAGAAGDGRLLRRLARPHRDEPVREALRDGRGRGYTWRRPSLGRDPRLGARPAVATARAA